MSLFLEDGEPGCDDDSEAVDSTLPARPNPLVTYRPPSLNQLTANSLEWSTHEVAAIISATAIVKAIDDVLTTCLPEGGTIAFDARNGKRLRFDWVFFGNDGARDARGTRVRVSVFALSDGRHAVEVQRRCGDHGAFMGLWRRLRAALGALEAEALAAAGFVGVVFAYGYLRRVQFDFPVERTPATLHDFALMTADGLSLTSESDNDGAHAVVHAGGSIRGELLWVRPADVVRLLRVCDAKEGLLLRTHRRLHAAAATTSPPSVAKTPSVPKADAATASGRLVEPASLAPSALLAPVRPSGRGLYGRRCALVYLWGVLRAVDNVTVYLKRSI